MPLVDFVTLVNDRRQFTACQESLRTQAKASFPKWTMVEPNTRGWNAAQGLNHGIESADADWVVCVHQDVRFPAGWWQRLCKHLQSQSADTAVIGLAGTESSGRFRGHVIDPNGHCYWPTLPSPVLTVDEHLVVVRKSSGLRFDPATPGFHCYGADVCLEAHARGRRVMVIDAPVLHLSTGTIDDSFERSSRWLLAKWGARHGFILPTPTIIIQDESRAGWLRRTLFRLRRYMDRRARNATCPDPDCSRRAQEALGQS